MSEKAYVNVKLFIIVLFTFLPSDISFDIIFQRLAKRWNSHVSRMYAART